jgi:lysophospholipase L1-like esterase
MNIACIIVMFLSLVSQRILIVGDSEAGAAGMALPLVKATTEKVTLVYRVSTKTSYWTRPILENILDKDDYDFVLVFLGTNDFDILPDTNTVVSAVAKDGRRCVWVGPVKLGPSHPGRAGSIRTNEYLKSHVSPCVYFDTQSLNIQMMPDGIHPTFLGAFKWLQAVWKLKNSLETSTP